MFVQLFGAAVEAMDLVGQLADELFQLVHRVDHMDLVSERIIVNIETSWQLFRNIFPVTKIEFIGNEIGLHTTRYYRNLSLALSKLSAT